MTTLDNNTNQVELIIDLRRFSETVDTSEKVERFWRQISPSLVGQSIANSASIKLDLPAGNVALWIVNANGNVQVSESTGFYITDVLRSPKLLYQCAVCGEYGPLRCVKCEEEGRETRLCSEHAHIIKDELSAYCPNHIPTCNCRDGCQEKAVFRCRSCARTNRQRSLYGQHYYRQHPTETDTDYCQRCYQWKFERCQAAGCKRLGRSKCHYQTRNMENPCNAPSCSDHSYQWKIWGPHNRGITLCEHHQNILASTEPTDLIFLILTAKAPFARRGKYHYMPNPFRLRRLINRHRTTPLSFAQLEYVLNSMEPLVANWGRNAERNYGNITKSFAETMGSLDGLERETLDKVRLFYQSRVGWDAASQILGLQIQDRYSKPGQPLKYRIHLIVTGEKGRLIGRGGAYINDLRNSLNLEVDLD